ncbi:FAD-dependent oxidoreductase [Pseudomonas sp. R3-56]|uniref:FAD-dependent oxidoreductase n=1 Tax=Pseudomonas sp. R3-56 TaxID=2817401 RepID=UPI003DA96C21
MFKRRDFIKGLILSSALIKNQAHAKEIKNFKIVVIGGGFAGATFIKTIRKLHPLISVTLIEPNRHYFSCPLSAEYLVGKRPLSSLEFSYDYLAKQNVNIICDRALTINTTTKTINTQKNILIHYDRCIVACGVGFKLDTIVGYDENSLEIIPHAWAGGIQHSHLRNKLLGIPDGENFLISVPPGDYKCPPGPYERASLIAEYFKKNKPACRVIILDSNNKFPKQPQFELAWSKFYGYGTGGSLIEWVSEKDGGAVKALQRETMELSTPIHSFKGGAINIIPPQQAAIFAQMNALTDATGWCPVNTQSMESLFIPEVHIIGDCAYAEMLPKSAFAAACQARVCAIAISRMIHDLPAIPPEFANICYSLCADDYGVSVFIKYQRNDLNNILEIVDLLTTPLNSDEGQYIKEAQSAHNMFTSLTRGAFY